jgi:hypothetical protein
MKARLRIRRGCGHFVLDPQEEDSKCDDEQASSGSLSLLLYVWMSMSAYIGVVIVKLR